MSRTTHSFHVGRDAEVAALLAAAGSPPALIVIQGEAGVGKTRLIEELLEGKAKRKAIGEAEHPAARRANGAASRAYTHGPNHRPNHEPHHRANQGSNRRVLVGRTMPLAQPFPLAPVIDALRGLASDLPRLSLTPLAGALRPLLPELAGHLPDAPEPLGDAAMERHRMLRAVAEVLAAVGPATLVLEDLHWADEATAELVCLLASERIDTLSLVLTHRPEDTGAYFESCLRSACSIARARLTRISLRPLGRHEVGALATAILGTGDMSEEFTSYLYERSSGLPLAVEEIVALLREREDVVRFEDSWARRTLDEIRVPDAISDLVLERFGRLAARVRVVIEAAAVLEVPVTREVVGKVSGLAPARARAAVASALSSGFLQEDHEGRLAFGHVLFKEAIYDAMEVPVRRRMHLRAGQVLAQDPRSSPGQLARHFRESDRPRRWLHYTEAAADLAASLGNHREASRLLIEALGASGLGAATKVRLAEKLGSAALEGLGHKEAMPVLERMIEDPSLSAGDRGEIRIALALLLDQGGDSSAGHRQLAAALPEVRRRPLVLANAYKNLAAVQVSEGHIDEHLEWLQRLEQLLEAHGHPGNWHVIVDRADLYLAIGDPRAWKMIEDIRRIERSGPMSHDWVRVTANFAINAFHLGHYEAARSFIAEGIALSEQLSFPRVASGFRATELLLDHATGRWDGLEQRATSLLATLPQVPHVVVDVELVLGLAALARGDLALAENILQAVIHTARGTGSVPVLAHASAGLALIHRARGRSEEAIFVTATALDAIAGKGIWVWAAPVAPAAVECLVAEGKAREAEALMHQFAGGIEGRDAPAAIASLMSCRALLAAAGVDSRAEPLFAAAESAWLRLPHPYQAALVTELRGKHLFATDTAAATAVLLDALDTYRSLGASWDQARVRRTLKEEGVALPHPWRGGRRGYGNELSPREIQVAELASDGLTNREIALQLYLSPRTVGHHVAKVLEKLGLDSRRNLRSSMAKIGMGDRSQASPDPSSISDGLQAAAPERPGRRAGG